MIIDTNALAAHGMGMQLSAKRFSKARDFIMEKARPLEKALYRFHFESGVKEDVIHELCAYQNADGGFGRIEGISL